MTIVTIEELRPQVAERVKAGSITRTAAIAEALGVAELDVMRALPAAWATELRHTDAEAILRSLESWGTIYFVGRNAACVTEIAGEFGSFSRTGPFLNTNGRNLHLHIRVDNIAAIVAVHYPADPGGDRTCSLQFFQADGASSFKVYVMRSVRLETDGDFSKATQEFERLVGAFRMAG